jgi:hypothetical protein
MLAGIARVDSWKKTPPNLSANNYALELDFDGMPAVDSNVLRAIQDASQPQTGYFMTIVRNILNPHDNPPYQNYIHKDGKSILCINNYAVRDSNQSRPIFWSDVMAACCIGTTEITGGEMRSLETIWRLQIENILTQGLFRNIPVRTETMDSLDYA